VNPAQMRLGCLEGHRTKECIVCVCVCVYVLNSATVTKILDLCGSSASLDVPSRGRS
jgi:hypothetical protein